MLRTTNTEFSFVEVCFTDQKSEIEEIEIEDNVNFTLIIGLKL